MGGGMNAVTHKHRKGARPRQAKTVRALRLRQQQGIFHYLDKKKAAGVVRPKARASSSADLLVNDLRARIFRRILSFGLTRGRLLERSDAVHNTRQECSSHIATCNLTRQMGLDTVGFSSRLCIALSSFT